MVLIYGKGKVGNSLKEFCEYNDIDSEIKDDSDYITDFSKYNKIIASPGIPPTNSIYKTGKVIGDLDFCFDYLPKGFKIISISGTDGKSTTAWIMYNILKQEFGDERTFLSGNFDEPFSKTVLDIQKRGIRSGWIVVEISSFMAYNIEKYTSTYSIFTNFEKDHQNWHPDMKDYLDSKLNIFRNTTKRSIVNSQVLNKAKELGLDIDLPNMRLFGAGNDLKDRVELPFVVISGRKKYDIRETNFSGPYNALNILAASIVGNETKICSKRIKGYLRNIFGLPHRIELYKEINGISFIDDSKSTSSQSLKAALETFEDNRIVLIAGGSDKGDTFDQLGDLFKKKVKHAEFIGQTREMIGKVFLENNISFHLSDSMAEAVKTAYDNAKPGDIILLSPGCASFGLFKDYLDRANKFKESVDAIAEID
ncbi:MAG: UDP-N-acetylmuramoyl-L-alanine--D-glutamate ligase [Candidatus Gracilibacteria bacterium]|nr:UDP-N-acetylmuramoyl-L-alanine--D-glutamate ligase [Candidatus Gracilibacteria bacterium]